MSVLIAMRDPVYAKMLWLEFQAHGVEAELILDPAALAERASARLTLMDAVYLSEGFLPPPRGEIMLLGYPEELSAIPKSELTKYLAVERPFAAEEFFAALFPAEEPTPPPHLRLSKKKSPSLHLALDESTRSVYYKGEEVTLTAREFALLKLLYEHRGTPVSREEALAVFRDEHSASNVVDVYINYLRTKLDHRFGIRLIATVRGRGYMIAGEAK